jgi:two-component system NarL family response regulator
VPPPPELIQVLLVGDGALSQLGAALHTEDGLRVVGEAHNSTEAVTHAEELLPDVIVTGPGLPTPCGITVCRTIKQRVPWARILMLTSSRDRAQLFEALRAGATSCLHTAGTNQIADAVRAVFHGDCQLSAVMARRLLLAFTEPSRSAAAPDATGAEPAGLTTRERQILQCAARGWPNRKIAAALGSPRTWCDTSFATSWRSCRCEPASKQ